MKKNLFILPFFILMATFSTAQLNKSIPLSPDSLQKAIPGKLFNQFVESVNGSAYTGSFAKEKKSLVKNIKKVSEPLEMAKKIASLAAYIKPQMFKSDFNLAQFQKRAADSKTMIYCMNMLSDLEAGLKPEAISGVWKFQKSSWLAEMTKVQ